MRVDVSKPQDESEDFRALDAVLGSDADIDARIDAIVDVTGVREELRRLAKAVRSLVRA